MTEVPPPNSSTTLIHLTVDMSILLARISILPSWQASIVHQNTISKPVYLNSLVRYGGGGLLGALLNHDAALVQQFAGFGEHGEQVAPQSDLVDHHVGFRLHQGVLRQNDVLIDIGAELVLLVLGVQVLLGEVAGQFGQLQLLHAALQADHGIEDIQPYALRRGADVQGVALSVGHGGSHIRRGAVRLDGQNQVDAEAVARVAEAEHLADGVGQAAGRVGRKEVAADALGGIIEANG